MVLPATAFAMLTIGTQHGRPQAPPPVTPIPELDISAPVKQATPPPPSVEALIDQLEQLRKQKAELEVREKALVEQLQSRLKSQSDRLQKLGVIAPTVPPPAAKEDVKFPDANVPLVPRIKDSKADDPIVEPRTKK
jgi:hypothetical protein